MKKPIVYDTEFREDLGLDADGYHRIRMGKTIYCVKDNVIFIVDATGALNRLEEAGLPKNKWWIRRNVNEVLGLSQKVKPEPKKEKLIASLVSKSRNSYVVAVNGTEYVICISSDFTKNFDEYVREANAPIFSWLSVQEIKNGMKQYAPADVVNDPEFQKVVKGVVNPQRKLARVADIMGYLTTVTTGEGKNARVINFKPSPTHHAKNSGALGGETGEVWLPDLKTNPTFLADLIKQAKAHINTLTPAQLACAKALEDFENWKQSCEEAVYASDLNQLTETLKLDKEHIYYQSMRQVMVARSKQRSIAYLKNLLAGKELTPVELLDQFINKGGVMDIKEKQAIWLKERPLFEAELIHSHLLPFFHFNENTGDYEIKTESVNNTDEEDCKVAYESLNTGWAMWLRAKRTAKNKVPEGFVLVPKELSENIAHQLAESEFKKSETIFNSSYRDLSIDAKNDLKQKLIEQKTRCIVVDYKTLISKAQEQSHE